MNSSPVLSLDRKKNLSKNLGVHMRPNLAQSKYMKNTELISTGKPSKWVERFSGLIKRSDPILDLAAGRGRHTHYFMGREHPVIAVDKDVSYLTQLENPLLLPVQVDLETRHPWPFKKDAFAGIVVTNYLHRPLFNDLVNSLAVEGLLIYETFARGNEKFGRPSNPNYLLAPGELLSMAMHSLHIIAYEDLTVQKPKLARVQRICARKTKN
mgnify:CR=1 FL=1